MRNNAYSKEETDKLLSLYDMYGTENLDHIAVELNKPIRSIRSKLVREGIYEPLDSSYTRKTGKSKKELLRELEEIVRFDTGGFFGATKESLTELLNFLEKDEQNV